MMKSSIEQEDVTIINIYGPNIRNPKCMRKALTEGRNRCPIITVGNFITSYSIADRTIRQDYKEIEDLNSTIDQLDQTDIYREYNSRMYIFLKCT